VLAPLASPVLYWAWNFVEHFASGPDGRRAVLQQPFRELLFIVAFGAPIAYAATVVALLGWPLLRLRGLAAPLLVGLAGVLAGIATTVIVHPLFGSGDLFRVVLTPVQGALLGGVSAVLFWWIWTRSRPRPG
jgi:hypothetical protein